MNKKEMLKFLQKTIVTDIRVASKFGIKIGAINFLGVVVFRSRSKMGKKLHILEHDMVKKYLKEKYGSLLLDFNYKEEQCLKDDAPIWVMWWQGISEASPLVKLCVESIEKHRGNREIIFIDRYNYHEYIDLPDYIMQKHSKGLISVAHLSDIIRFCLLYQYGGIWMDATLFATDKIDKLLSDYSIYSIHHEVFSEYHVCKGLWTTFFFSANKENCIIKLVQDFLLLYWQYEDYPISYLFLDCIIGLAYENLTSVQEQIDAILVNNTKVFELQPLLCMHDSESDIQILLKGETNLFKLSYKLSVDLEEKGIYLKKSIHQERK